MLESKGQLVGRDTELARLTRALDDLGSTGIGIFELGSARTAVFQVVGEPGIGKSRLVAEVAERASERDYLVFTGRAAELERDFPFGVVIDALDPYLASVNPVHLGDLSTAHKAELGCVFPSLAGLRQDSRPALQDERYRSYRAVRALLEVLALRRPCLIALDDLHWADQASLELLGHLLRRPPGAPVMLVLAFRPPQAPPKLLSPLEAAERDGVCERLELAPLERAEAEELLDPSLDPELRGKIHRESGGNPFYLEQLARAARRGRLPASPEPSPDAEVPRAVQRALGDELAALSPASRLVVESAAVAGEPFSPDLVADAVGVEEGNVLAALDELLELDLVRPTQAPREFRFRHPIVRRAIYESLPAGARLAAHARAAAALAERDAPATLRAHHVERSGRLGDAEAIGLLTEAAHTTATRAPATAARWFGAALRLIPEGPRAAEPRLALLVPMARALASAGRLDESRRTLDQVLDLLTPELAPLRGQVISFMSMLERLVGRHREARTTIEQGLAELSDQESAEAVGLQVELASNHYFEGDWQRARDAAETACRLTRQLGDPALSAAASAVLGLAYCGLGLSAEARGRMADARAFVDGASDEELAPRLDAFHWLAWLEHHMESYDEVVRHMERGLAISRRTSQGHLLVPMTIGLVIAKGWSGQIDEAIEHSEAAVEIARLLDAEQLLALTLNLRCWLAVRAGDLPRVVRFGEEAMDAVGPVASSPHSIYAGAWLAEAQVEAGAPARGRDALVRATGGPDLPLVEPGLRAYFYEVLTRAELALGHCDEAKRWAERAATIADGLELAGPTGWALRAAAETAMACDEPQRGAELALESAAAAGGIHPVEGARARIVAGRALSLAGARDQAVAELERARSELASYGAGRLSDCAARELRRLGEHVGRRGVRSPGTDGFAGLSARELEVARLVADRLTNREIAERLVLSEKTIETHLASVFRKLGASSRVEVARTLEASAVSLSH